MMIGLLCVAPTLLLLMDRDPATASLVGPAAASGARYRAAMLTGLSRRQHDDPQAAIRAFEEALTYAPSSARVYTELGRAALQAHDLDRALRASQQAVALASDPWLRGVALHTLGLVQARRGDVAAARGAFQASLMAHPSPVVRDELSRVGGAGRDPLHAVALDGPYPTTDDYCRLPSMRKRCRHHESLDYAVGLGGAYKVLAVFKTRDEDLEYEQLALRTAAGWYFSDPVLERFQRVSRDHADRLIDNLTASSQGDGGALSVRVQVHTSERVADAGHEDEVVTAETDAQLLVACGGAAPSCTAPLPVQSTRRTVRRDAMGEEVADLSWEQHRLKAHLLPGGELELRPLGEPLLPEQQRLLGRHALGLRL